MFHALIIYNIIINCTWGQTISYDAYLALALTALYAHYSFSADDNISHFQTFQIFFLQRQMLFQFEAETVNY